MESQSRNHRITESQKHGIMESQSRNHRTTESQNHGITESLNQILESQNHGITESRNHNHGITESRNHRITESQNHGIRQSRNHGITESQSRNHKITAPVQRSGSSREASRERPGSQNHEITESLSRNHGITASPRASILDTFVTPSQHPPYGSQHPRYIRHSEPASSLHSMAPTFEMLIASSEGLIFDYFWPFWGSACTRSARSAPSSKK